MLHALAAPAESTPWTWAPGAADRLAASCAGGRGAVLVSAHCGPWEALASAVAGAGYPAGLVVRPLRDPALDALVQRLRTARGVRLFARGTTSAITLVEWVRTGGVLGVVLDQAPRGRSITATWWGVPAATAAGPAWLAARAGVPLHVATASRSRGGAEVRIQVSDAIPVASVRSQDVRRATREATRVLDAHLRESPMDWVWFHDRLGGAD